MMNRAATANQPGLGALVLVLLLAAALRWAALSDMSDLLGFDESYYAADAAGLLELPRLTPFFPGNNGRESGWVYLLAGFVAGAGLSPFTVRLAAAFVGVIAVAATYRLGREMFGHHVGLGAAASMAVLYWPVHLSHIAMRANLLPALGALSLAFLLGALRKRRLRWWVATGLCSGALVYSYTSAHLWALLVGSLLIFFAARKQRGAFAALGLTFIVALPLAIYAWQHPDQVLMRAGQSVTLSGAAVLGASAAWLQAWFVRGDILLNHNIPGRPILDWSSAALFGAGLLNLLRQDRWRVALIAALAGISILPSLLSEFPPHFLRSIGLTVPIALVMGLGTASAPTLLAALMQRARAPAALVAGAHRLAGWAAAGLLTTTAGISFYDFHHVWLNLPAIEAQFERPIHRAVQVLVDSKGALLPGAPIYLVPYELTHPVIQFSRRRLPTHRIGAFDSRACLVVSRLPSVYVVAQDKEAALPGALGRWGDISVLGHSPGTAIVQLMPDDGRVVGKKDWVTRFGGAIEVRAAATDTAAARRGDELSWLLRFRALRSLARPYSLFVHLYRVEGDRAIDDQRKWAQGDQQLCASYPTTLWQPDEVVIQRYRLSLPADAPPGRYAVAIGIYDSESGERLVGEGEVGYQVMLLLDIADESDASSRQSR